MLLRVVIPLADMCLILCLATVNISVALKRMGRAVNLTPFLIWWCFGLGRAIVDSLEYGIWALRDAAQVIESLWLIVAFTVARKTGDIDKLFQWLKWLFVAYSVYALGAPFSDYIAAVSPSIAPAAAGAVPVPVIGIYENLSLMLLWIAFYLTITEYKDHRVRTAGIAIACLMIGVVVIILQARELFSADCTGLHPRALSTEKPQQVRYFDTDNVHRCRYHNRIQHQNPGPVNRECLVLLLHPPF
jgi:hypothetical protein